MKESKCKMAPLTMSGHWFVNFGSSVDDSKPKIEGSKIIEINGTVADCDNFLDELSDKIFDTLPQDIKDIAVENDLKLIIRSMTKLD